MDYTTLIGSQTTAGSIKNTVNKTDTPAAVVVEDAEDWIYRRLRTADMLVTTTGTITTSADTIALPSDYLTGVEIKLTGTDAGDMERKTPKSVRADWSYDASGARVTGKPSTFFKQGSDYQLNRPADKSYPFNLLYYKRPTALSTATATNFLTNSHPRLLRCATNAFAFEWHQEDSLMEYWLKRAAAEVEEINSAADLEMGQGLIEESEAV